MSITERPDDPRRTDSPSYRSTRAFAVTKPGEISLARAVVVRAILAHKDETIARLADERACLLAESLVIAADRDGHARHLEKYNAALKEPTNGESPSDDALAAAYREIQYKYFGDYELSEGQWDAIFILERASRFMRKALTDFADANAEIARLSAELEGMTANVDLVNKNAFQLLTGLQESEADRNRLSAELEAARTFNVNNEVWVRLTAEGKLQLRHAREDLAKTWRLPLEKFPEPPAEDENGFSRWQLWHLMSQLGPHLFNGCKVPFETTFYLSEPTAAALAKLTPAQQSCPAGPPTPRDGEEDFHIAARADVAAKGE